MADLYLPDELGLYLIDQGIAQHPSTAPSSVLPSVWVNPQDGPPVPRDGESCTITIRDTLAKPPASLEAWMTEIYVDVIVRHRDSDSGCRLVHRTIHGLIAPIDQYTGRHMWLMHDLLIETSTGWRGEQPLPIQQTGDLVTVDRVAAYRFLVRRKSLAGQPYVP